MTTSPTSALVVCESMFGNTRALGDVIGEVLHERFDRVDVVTVDDAPPSLAGIELLVVGAPTHALGMSRPSTRLSAFDQGAPGVPGTGVREWIASLSPTVAPVSVALFDTRIRKPYLPGRAVRAMRRRFRRLHHRVVATTSFAVTGTPGPLAPGELDRARTWAAMLPAAHRSRVVPSSGA